MQRYRHIGRGSFYRVIGTADVQAATGPITEDEQVEIYRAEADGTLWVRRHAEFHDGRFELVREDDRTEATAQEVAAACAGQAFGEMIDALDLALHRMFGASMTHLINLEQLRLLRDIHAIVVGKAPPASADLVAAARAVVEVRHSRAGWDMLSAAIGRLEDLVGREGS